MNYDNEIIRDIADVANPETDRKLAIADSQKVKNVSLGTLKITTRELGLPFAQMTGQGEDGKPCEFLVVGADQETVDYWMLELGYVDAYGTSGLGRRELQANMGVSLGYPLKDVIDFLDTEVAKTCPCTCCGGTPQ